MGIFAPYKRLPSGRGGQLLRCFEGTRWCEAILQHNGYGRGESMTDQLLLFFLLYISDLLMNSRVLLAVSSGKSP